MNVVIVGFQGVQAMDVVGPFDVFTGASLKLRSEGKPGYDVTLVSADGRPVSTGTGLTLHAEPLPDPHEPIDTVVLPGGYGVDEARRTAKLMAWITTPPRRLAAS